MRHGTLLMLPLLLLTPLGPAKGADETAPDTAPAVAGEEQKAPSVTVTVVDAGGSPKSALRYAPEVGDLQTIVLSISTSVANQMGNLPMPAMKLPTTVSTLTARVDDVQGGEITATIRIDEASLTETEDVQPMIVKQIESTVAGSVGQSARMVMSDRGIGRSFTFGEDAKGDPAAAQAISSLESTLAMLSTPLPEEPIGPGASWTVESTLEQMAVSVTQKVTYTLKSIKDGVMEIELKVEHSAPAQGISMPGAPPGTEVTLSSLSLEGTGTATVSLSSVVPGTAEVTSTGVSEIDITQSNGGDPQHFKQTMDSRATVTQKED